MELFRSMKKFFLSLVLLFSLFFGNFSCIFAESAEVSGVKISSNGDSWSGNKRINMVKKTVASLFFRFDFSGLMVLIDKDQVEPRGQIQGKNMKLSASVQSDAEFLKLFTHELGHFVDIYVLRGNTPNNDPSSNFYAISWQSSKVKKTNSSLSSFVSGYAATNQYEDFAETFVWYIFHNEKFLDAAMKNEQMRLKYLFFADTVFVHGEFMGTDFTLGNISNYRWDTTKVPILFQNYLNFLG